MFLPLAQVPFFMKVVGFIWIAASLFLGLIILIQKGKGGGLGAAFGGAGGSLLGTKTGDVLTWVTITFTVVFLGLAVLMDKFYVPTELESLKTQQVTEVPAVPQEQEAATDQEVPAETPEKAETADSQEAATTEAPATENQDSEQK